VFCTRRGLFHFNRMPFGLSGAPATFCRLMQKVLKDELWKICLFYLDDVIAYAKAHRELLERLNTVISVLGEAGLKVKPSKCSLLRLAFHSWVMWFPNKGWTHSPKKSKL